MIDDPRRKRIIAIEVTILEVYVRDNCGWGASRPLALVSERTVGDAPPQREN
jgi:hypothetical protein